MNTAGSHDSAAALIEALSEAARLLEAGDAEGAAGAIAQVVGRCPSVSAQGLGPEGVAIARQLLERCRAAEAPLRRKVTDEMNQLNASQRAHSVYQR